MTKVVSLPHRIPTAPQHHTRSVFLPGCCAVVFFSSSQLTFSEILLCLSLLIISLCLSVDGTAVRLRVRMRPRRH